MQRIKPNFFDEFKCVGGSCSDNCCKAGWDIVVDDKTYRKYLKFSGKLGERVKNYIYKEYGQYHIRLTDKKICPFLDEKNMCSIILDTNENNLCDICKEHPRFHNYLGMCEEIGLGLCCEEACRLLLSQNKLFNLIGEYSLKNNEKTDYLLREEIFKILTNESLDYNNCLNEIINRFKTVVNVSVSDVFNSCELEFLDEKFKDYFNKDLDNDFTDVELKNLLKYIIFRYYFANNYHYSKITKVYFSIILINFITKISVEVGDKINRVKLVSKEIEYSENNVNSIMNFIEKKIKKCL